MQIKDYLFQFQNNKSYTYITTFSIFFAVIIQLCKIKSGDLSNNQKNVNLASPVCSSIKLSKIQDFLEPSDSL